MRVKCLHQLMDLSTITKDLQSLKRQSHQTQIMSLSTINLIKPTLTDGANYHYIPLDPTTSVSGRSTTTYEAQAPAADHGPVYNN